METVQSGGVMLLAASWSFSETVESGERRVSARVGNDRTADACAYLFVSSGGAIAYSHAGEGGTITVYSGGVASSGTVGFGGVLDVFGKASGVTVSSGGAILVTSGGDVSKLQLLSGAQFTADTTATIRGTHRLGSFTLLNGHAKNFLLESGGKLQVLSGGNAENTVLNAGGTQTILNGSSLETVVNSGGREVVSRLGLASSSTVYSGGSQVLAGGALKDAHIASGGSLIVSSASSLKSNLTLGGEMTFVGNGSLDCGNFTVFFDVREDVAGRASPLIVDYSKLSNCSLAISVVAEQKNGIYRLASGVSEFSSDTLLSLYSDGKNIGSLSVGGSVYTTGKRDFRLVLTQDVLTLSIENCVDAGDVYTAATPLVYEVPHVESIGYEEDKLDFFRLDLDCAGRYTISMAASAMNAKVTLLGANGKTVLGSATIGANGLAEIASKLLTSGTYYLKVENTDKGKTAGKYEIVYGGELFNHPGNTLLNNTWDGADVARTDVTGVGDFLENVVLITDEWVGLGDAIDFQQIAPGAAGRYNFTVSELEAKTKLTLYQLVTSAKGKQSLKKIKSVTTSDISAGFSGVLLDAANTYFVAVEAPNAKKGGCTGYEVRLDGELFNHAGNALQNSTWNAADVAVTRVTGEGDVLRNVALIADEWVGFTDAIDFQQLELGASGSYSFTLTGVEGKAKLTLYQLVTSKSGKQSLKAIKSISVSEGEGGFSNLLLDSSNTYFVAVQAPSASKGVGTKYEVYLDGMLFNHAGNAFKNNTWNGEEVQNTFVASPDRVALLADEWVGFGDTIDFQRFSVGADGAFNLSLEGVENKLKVTVYEVLDNGKVKKLKTKTVSAACDVFSGLTLYADRSYAISVEAPGASKGQNSAYTLSIEGILA